MTTADTIPARFVRHAQLRPDRPAYYVRASQGWEMHSWRDYVDQVRRVTNALVALGMEPGDKVAILGFNRPEWVVMAMATMAAGGAPAGIYTTSSPEEVAYIVDHSEAVVVLVEDEYQWEKIREKRTEMPRLRHVVLMQGAEPIADPLVSTWEEFLARADEVPADTVDRRIESLKLEDLASLIYTSGTTGPPKAVMLSHRSLAWTASEATGLLELTEEDSALSYLPLSHIAEQMFTVHGPATVGSVVYFAESMEQLPDNLKEVQPTLFFGVPRVWEKFQAAIGDKIAELTGPRRSLVEWAMAVGKAFHGLAADGKAVPAILRLQYGLARRLVFSKLKPAIGLGRARVCVSGAAPIAPSVLSFLAGLDLVVHEVYGQSEDCGPTSFNRPGGTRFGTVGQPFPGVEVRIDEDGEVLVRGPNVFDGYYKDPEATAEALVDGWLRSGDLGSMDEAGYLTITGRKKDIIITAGGKNITPANIEVELMEHELVAQAVVIGDRRKFLTALLTLDGEAVERFAAEHGVPRERAHASKELIAEIQRGVDAVNRRLARVETIRRFRILETSFTIDGGELTPTMKIKRNVVARRYAEDIEAMYQ